MTRFWITSALCISFRSALSAEPTRSPVPAATSADVSVPVLVLPEKPLSRVARMRAFQMIGRKEAEDAKVPFDLVDAVLKVESDFDPTRVGDVGEIGLMQVRPSTAAMLGFNQVEGSLADPATNIHYGTLYLAGAWRLSKGNVCRTLMKYRAGHGQEAMSTRSVSYCSRAKTYLTSIASPLAATITPADLVATLQSPADLGAVSSVAGPADRIKPGPGFWNRWQTRIKRINAHIEAKWRKTATR